MFRLFLWVAVFLAVTPFHGESQQAGSGLSSAQTLSNLTWYAPPRSVGHDSLGGVQILTKLNAEQSRIMDDKHVTRKMMAAIYRKWLPLIPEEAGSPTFKKGSVSIELTLYPDGSVHNMRLAEVSGDVALDRAAWEAITGASKYAPFPAGLDLLELRLRFRFTYNEDEASATQPPAP
jgi:TonB family protein